MKKEITIKTLVLNNFKGIKSLHVDFENQTDIYGANGTGKTTIADAVNWLWFGKDSSDRKDFEIKTLDATGKTNPKTQVEVLATYLIDGNEVTLKRVLKENWVKKRGTNDVELAGNVTELYWNEVPMLLGDFNKKVDTVVNEFVFKNITSPVYFNQLEWKQRRSLLISMVGEVSDEEIASRNPAYLALIANLTQGKTMDEYKAQIANSIKKAKDDLKAIPTRIDEVSRTKPEAQAFDLLETDLRDFNQQLIKVDEQLTNANKAFNVKLEAQKGTKISINNLEAEITNIQNSARREAQQRLTPDNSELNKLVNAKNIKEQELATFENGLKTLESQKQGFDNEVKNLEPKVTAKRAEWETENAKELVFADNDCKCPTCQREYDASVMESKKVEMLAAFKSNKIAKLNEITSQGQSLANQVTTNKAASDALAIRIENGTNEIKDIKEQIEALKVQIESYNSNSANSLPSEQEIYESILALDMVYGAKVKELETLKSTIEEIPTVDNSELTAKRSELVALIDGVKAKLQTKAQIEAVDKRIQELQNEERTLAQQVADVEKIQFTIENFIKDKIDRLESAINSKFKTVQFKMFDEQINGGLKETCVAMVNGVPYTDVNTASKINAGIDIINTLCDFYGVSAPIFIDNAESVHTLIDTDSQLVRLVVSESHKKLTVECKEMVA